MISSRGRKPKSKKIPKLSFKTQVVLWRKRSVRIFSTDQRKLGFNKQIFLEMEIPKTAVKLKGFMVCVEKMKEDKEKFDTSKKGLQFWQKHNGISKLSVTE